MTVSVLVGSGSQMNVVQWKAVEGQAGRQKSSKTIPRESKRRKGSELSTADACLG